MDRTNKQQKKQHDKKQHNKQLVTTHINLKKEKRKPNLTCQKQT